MRKPDMSNFHNLWEIKLKGSHVCQNNSIGQNGMNFWVMTCLRGVF